jgi:hypothetical protein
VQNTAELKSFVRLRALSISAYAFRFNSAASSKASIARRIGSGNVGHAATIRANS